MSSPVEPSSSPSDSFVAAFLQQADADAQMPFDRFMELALYHPELGYYRRDRPRVGREKGTDFYTSTSSGHWFGEMVVAACETLLGREALAETTFVEIGAETRGGVLEGVSHAFAGTETIKLGNSLEISGRCVVFSNELFDAQPFRRFLTHEGVWVEQGVAWQDHQLIEVPLRVANEPWLPSPSLDGYRFDAPRRAVNLLAEIAAQPWTGLFIAADYGKSWEELRTACPSGTARAYSRHRQSNDLLATPGEQDLTCHVCWDWLEDALREHHFTRVSLQSQESFFVHHAGSFLSQTLYSESIAKNPRKQAIMQLLHPGNLGQKFQILHGMRSS